MWIKVTSFSWCLSPEQEDKENERFWTGGHPLSSPLARENRFLLGQTLHYHIYSLKSYSGCRLELVKRFGGKVKMVTGHLVGRIV